MSGEITQINSCNGMCLFGKDTIKEKMEETYLLSEIIISEPFWFLYQLSKVMEEIENVRFTWTDENEQLYDTFRKGIFGFTTEFPTEFFLSASEIIHPMVLFRAWNFLSEWRESGDERGRLKFQTLCETLLEEVKLESEEQYVELLKSLRVSEEMEIFVHSWD